MRAGIGNGGSQIILQQFLHLRFCGRFKLMSGRTILMATRNSSPRGFTLVELLVVIGIVGILVALIIPAVQAAREASRRTQCRNNLKQMALGANGHLANHRFFPAGGWGWGWAGDSNYGYDLMQPGGWMYNILPYIEEAALHDLGKGITSEDDPARRAAIKQAIETVVPLYFCPARRPAEPRPFVHYQNYINLGSAHRPRVVARNDYAACAGDQVEVNCVGPSRYADWSTYSCWDQAPNDRMNGITVTRKSGLVGIKKVTDGASKTILYGEKYLRVERYEADDHDNDQGWNLGFDSDLNRFCKEGPHQDELGQHYRYYLFGSAHIGGAHFAKADGAVQAIPYSVDAEVFRRLGVRNDGMTVHSP
jgi:prepilin-type N-terminal cleavage/methylation domain-containing protein